MKFDKFTLKAQEALATAQQIAMAKSHTVLTTLHLLSAACGGYGINPVNPGEIAVVAVTYVPGNPASG